MRERGQVTIILAAVLALVVGVAATIYLVPELIGPVPGITEKRTFANVDVEVWMDSGQVGTNIQSVSVYNKVVPAKVLGAWFSDTFDGKIKVIAKQGSRRMDKKAKDISIWANWLSANSKPWTVKGLALGTPGDGEVEIIVRLMNNDGVKVDQDSTTRTI